MMVVVEHALMLPKKQQQPNTIPLSEVDSMDINTSYCFMVEYMDQKTTTTTTTTTNPTRHPHLRTLTLFSCWFIIGQHFVP